MCTSRLSNSNVIFRENSKWNKWPTGHHRRQTRSWRASCATRARCPPPPCAYTSTPTCTTTRRRNSKTSHLEHTPHTSHLLHPTSHLPPHLLLFEFNSSEKLKQTYLNNCITKNCIKNNYLCVKAQKCSYISLDKWHCQWNV